MQTTGQPRKLAHPPNCKFTYKRCPSVRAPSGSAPGHPLDRLLGALWIASRLPFGSLLAPPGRPWDHLPAYLWIASRSRAPLDRFPGALRPPLDCLRAPFGSPQGFSLDRLPGAFGSPFRPRVAFGSPPGYLWIVPAGCPLDRFSHLPGSIRSPPGCPWVASRAVRYDICAWTQHRVL